MFKWKGYLAAARGSPARRAYHSWRNLRIRCDDRSGRAYRHYGGRGITYDPRWKSFEQFATDMGLPLKGMCLDRIDNDGPYCKDNCRWATRKQQNRNTRRNRIIEFRGERKSLTCWAEQLGINRETLRGRLDSGWPLERALSSEHFDCSRKPTPDKA